VIPVLATGLVLAGALILAGALVILGKLVRQLPAGTLRDRWYGMGAFIVIFLAGYLGYAALFWNRHAELVDLIVPAIFFFGACFVWLTAALSFRTTLDVMRISLLEKQTFTDGLTGLFNRRYLDRRLGEEVATARRYGRPLSVLMLDFDHFKLVNDRFGHQAGDAVLVTAGKILAKGLRETDILARYGGEEFLVMAPHTPHGGAIELAERLRRRIELHDFSQGEEGALPTLRVTVSFGIATFGEGTDTVEALIALADENLYHAKREGRNRVCAGRPSGADAEGGGAPSAAAGAP